MSRDLAADLLARCRSVWNLYGPTETTIWSAVHHVTSADGPIPIGHPIANTELFLLDGDRNPTPVGVPGEIYIGGDGLARGYRGSPDLTQERFVESPFGTNPKDRLYHTGDLARRLPDGSIEWLARVDQQVKISGFRVEPSEIEAVIRKHPVIRDVAVTVRADELGESRLEVGRADRVGVAAEGRLRPASVG